MRRASWYQSLLFGSVGQAEKLRKVQGCRNSCGPAGLSIRADALLQPGLHGPVAAAPVSCRGQSGDDRYWLGCYHIWVRGRLREWLLPGLTRRTGPPSSRPGNQPLSSCSGRRRRAPKVSALGQKLTSAMSHGRRRSRAAAQSITRAYPCEASRDGNVRRTIVPWLPLSRSSWPPSCWEKASTNRPPIPESARRGSTPLPSSETVR